MGVVLVVEWVFTDVYTAVTCVSNVSQTASYGGLGDWVSPMYTGVHGVLVISPSTVHNIIKNFRESREISVHKEKDRNP